MSDQPPPPKSKPGSLRDRIAAFEKPSSSSSAPAAPPPVRPKPGNISWKPAPPSPTTPTTGGAAATTPENEERKRAGMSASDAKESIGKGGSLKERMAALQGKGAFGGGVPPSPPPVGPKPTKRAPLVVSPPPADEEEEKEKALGEPKPESTRKAERKASVESAGDDAGTPKEEKEEPAEEEQDEEAKERERRAAIAARMARLGGARVGMGAPPGFGKKPEAKEKPKEVREEPQEHKEAPELKEDPKETSTPATEDEGIELVRDDPNEKSTSLSVHDEEGTSPQKESKTEAPRIITDEETTSKDSVVHPPPSASASPSESRPTPDSSSSQSSVTTTRSPPPSMPLPAVPRRAGPPRSKSARNMKAQAAKQDQEVGKTPPVPAESQAEPTVAAATSPEAEAKSPLAVQDKAGEDDVVSAQEPKVSEPSAATSPKHEPTVVAHSDLEDRATLPSPAKEAQEERLSQEVPKSPDEATHEQPRETISNVPAASPADVVRPHEPDSGVHPSVAEESGESAADIARGDIGSERDVETETPIHHTDPSIEEPQAYEQPEPEVAVSTEDHADHADPQLEPSGHDDEVAIPLDLPSPEVKPDHPALPTPPAEPEAVEPVAETVAVQEAEQPTTAAAEDEDEETARRKRIAERMAKMGGRNPFAAGPFGAPAPPRKASGDKIQESASVSPVEEPSTVEKEHGNEDIVSERKPVAENTVPSESHEAKDPGPRVTGVAQEPLADDDEPAIEDSLEEHEATEPEHKIPSQPLSSEPEEHSDPASPAEEYQSAEEVAEMAPPRITRAVPPPPPETPPKEPTMPPVTAEYKRASQRQSIPPLPEDTPQHRDEVGHTPEEQTGVSDYLNSSPLVQEPSSLVSPQEWESSEKAVNSSPSSPASKRSIPPIPRARPASPAHGISRRSMPPPPRAIPVLPHEDQVETNSPDPPPPPPARAVSPPAHALPASLPARPASPGTDSAVSPTTSVRRSIPPPRRAPSQPSEDAVPPPPRRSSSQTAEEITPPPRRVSSQPTEDAVDVNSQSHASMHIQQAASDAHTAVVDSSTIEEQEVLEESEADPIDPSFHSPPRSPAISPSAQERPSFTASSKVASGDTAEDDPEQARRRTIAERMAKLGGIRFGAPPSIPRKVSAPPAEKSPTDDGVKTEDTKQGDATTDIAADEPPELSSEESERARRQAIAARLAGMGGMRFGMLPQASAPAHPRDRSDSSQHTVEQSPPPPQRTQPPPPPSESAQSEVDVGSEDRSVSDEGVKVEAGSEMSMEEINAEDAEEDAEEPPPVPSRPTRQPNIPPPQMAPPLPGGRRPPVPTSQLPSRPPVPSSESGRPSVPGSLRKPSDSSGAPAAPSGDFVLVDDLAREEDEVPPPPPPPRAVRPPRGVPPPAPAPRPSAPGLAHSQWELPDIPSGSFDVSVGGGLPLDASITSEDSTTYPHAPSPPPTARPVNATPTTSSTGHGDVQLSPDELLQLWGSIGTAVHAVASALYDKSKKSLVGDGTSQGFVNAVLAQVPQASKTSYGYLIYSQNAHTVLRRTSNIMPGDIIQLTEAKLKGHKGLQSYHQTAGTSQQPLVAVVSEFDVKKSKVKVYQANQHVGAQTVETVSYRLEDLKSGNVKVFRVASA